MREVKNGYYVANKVIVYLKETSSADMNLLWSLCNKDLFTLDDLKEFYQLIGYSVEGYKELFNEE